jgi:uncharacterized membrane protein YfcA
VTAAEDEVPGGPATTAPVTGDSAAGEQATAALRTGAKRLWLAGAAGAAVGLLGGLVGLGGAEFRLPLLIAVFGLAALSAVIVNKCASLVVVLTAIPARLGAVPIAEVADRWWVVTILLAGSLPGAWLGAAWATRLRTATLYRVLGGLMAAIAVLFGLFHVGWLPTLDLPLTAQIVLGAAAGFGAGVCAAILGVAGGELYLPILSVLFALDVRLAGSLTLLVSPPTMLLAFARYSRSQAFGVLRGNARFVAALTAGSVAGSVAGGLLLGVVPSSVLEPLVVALLAISAVKIWRHA